MRRLVSVAALATAAIAAPAGSEVVSSSANAFHVRHSEPLVATQEDAWNLLRQPALWWNGEHSYSLDAANFYLELKPGGCFCERMPDGGFVEHMRVLSFTPGEELVLEGMLGPLRTIPATGVLVFKLESQGGNSRITSDFKVVGFPEGNGTMWAGAVDGVIGEQMKRLRSRAASKGRRGNPL
ncbi:ATPase [Sphingomicrobium clamense]|uniref:ATPase n=1 Tax=Sphingomicrobium clamense TaxID=2851013 RepID=A0ABS6V4L6_9SPHN|nr:ATPase [Sphingomicrobium sp. B8]MBW0144501.1 ATPase [Sphingomicrobium sp. B8]